VRVTVSRGRPVDLGLEVPGDKSIAHRWLLLAATADGASEFANVPAGLDVRSTARFCAALGSVVDPSQLDGWASNPLGQDQRDGSTANGPRPRGSTRRIEARGRHGLEVRRASIDCGNSGTTMRLGAGILASANSRVTLEGDASLSRRPMERVAAPLRRMGASVVTVGGHAPITVEGSSLRGIAHRSEVPSAQVKSAILLAGLTAEGATVVDEPVTTRDHTERALRALGAPVHVVGTSVRVERFQHDGFAGGIPGDVSSAAFVVAATALTGGSVEISGVGLNPTRTRFLDVLARMGVRTQRIVEGDVLGEPVGTLMVARTADLAGVTVEGAEFPELIDEVPVLAILAATARDDSRFVGAGELRVKESDRLGAIVRMIRGLGGDAAIEGDDLVVAGGDLDGGSFDAGGDHRLAMAAAVAGTATPRPVAIEGAEVADVSFPGFFGTLARLGADVEG
jgi:3-phosphoshikimate 1-carboxyvinyltransferase